MFCSYFSGNNAKSTLGELTHVSLGDYSQRLNSDVIQNLNPDRASIASIHKKRNILIEEPDSRRDVNGSALKEINSGTRRMSSRRLYSTDSKIRLECTTSILCNKLPSIKPLDEAMKLRLRIFHLNSRFVKNNAHVDPENHIYPVNPIISDPEFSVKYGMQWIHLLVRELREIYDDNTGMVNLTVPQEMEAVVDEYSNDQNIFLRVFLEKFELVQDSTAVVKFDRIVKHFRGSELWDNLPRKERVGGCSKFVYDGIQGNSDLKARFHERKMVQGVSYRKCLLRLREKQSNVSQQENEGQQEDRHAGADANDIASNNAVNAVNGGPNGVRLNANQDGSSAQNNGSNRLDARSNVNINAAGSESNASSNIYGSSANDGENKLHPRSHGLSKKSDGSKAENVHRDNKLIDISGDVPGQIRNHLDCNKKNSATKPSLNFLNSRRSGSSLVSQVEGVANVAALNPLSNCGDGVSNDFGINESDKQQREGFQRNDSDGSILCGDKKTESSKNVNSSFGSIDEFDFDWDVPDGSNVNRVAASIRVGDNANVHDQLNNMGDGSHVHNEIAVNCTGNNTPSKPSLHGCVKNEAKYNNNNFSFSL